MSHKENQSKEVDDIRKILFGDQVAQIQDQFSGIENAVSQLRAENRNLRQALEAEISQREHAIEMTKQLIETLENKIQRKLDVVEEVIKADTSSNLELLNALQQIIEKRIKYLDKTAK